MTILGISTDQPEFSDASVPAYSLMDLKNIGTYSLGQEVLRVGIYIAEPVSHDCIINFALYDITDTDYENNASGQAGPAGAIKAWEGSLLVSVDTPTGWLIQEFPRGVINCNDGRILGYAFAPTLSSIVSVRRTTASNGGSAYTGEDILPEIWEHSSGLGVNVWAFVEIDVPPAGLSEVVPPAVDAVSANYTNNNLPLVIGFHPWELPFEAQGTMIRHSSSTVGNWLNILGAGQVDANHRVKGFGVQLNIVTASGVQLTVALYKLTDLLGDAPHSPIKVWEHTVTLPEPIISTTWLYFPVPDGQIQGIENGDTLVMGFSGAEEGRPYSICVSEGTGQLSHYTNITSLELPDEFISSNTANAVINGYVELQPEPGLFETVPAAVDSVVGEFSPSAEPVVFGVNFRDTLGYVTDPPGTAGWVRNEQYPTTRAGITFGMVAPPSSYYSRNRNASTDPRLAGLTQVQNSGVLTHRIDLLRGPNTYRVRIAAGDFSNPKTQNLRIRDGAGGPVLLQFSGVVSAANQFLDATGVARTAAQWPSNNVPVDLIFTADHCIIELGQGAGGSTSNDTGLAHISFEYFPPAPTEFDGVIAESLPPATDAITGTFAAPIYTAAITELVPAALDALQGSYADAASFAGVIAEAMPPAVDAINAALVAPVVTGVVAEFVPPAVDAITANVSAPEFSAQIVEQMPAAVDAIVAINFGLGASAFISETVPAALDAGTGTTTAHEYTASIAEVLPAASDMLLMGYALAPVAGDVAELVPAAVDAAQGSFALDAAGAVIAESVPAAVDALAGSVSVPVFAGAVAEVLPPAADQVSAQFAPHRFAAAVAEAVPAAQDALQAGHFIEPVSGFIVELLPAAVDAVAGFFVPIPDAHSGIAEQVPAAVDALSATAAVPQYVAALTEVLPAAMDAVRVITREYAYQPDAMRTVVVEPERREFFVEPESRVFLIAPERRTLTVGV